MWHGKKVSVGFATYREKNAVREAIEDFLSNEYVDEAVVVNNNAEAGTDEEVGKTKARLVHETRQGYGWAFRRALLEASGEYIILAEPDATFRSEDVGRLLAYADAFPVVFGSRTNTAMIVPGANMGFVNRLGHTVCATTMRVLFKTPRITDVACTMKLFRRDALEKIVPRCSATNSLLVTELMLVTIDAKIPFVEIPVRYAPRNPNIGESVATATMRQLFKYGWLHYRYIWHFWLLRRGRYSP